MTGLWLGVLTYLNFQLRRRRWAALRVAGCERVLAEWIVSPPSDAKLAPGKRDPTTRISWWGKFVAFFWPLKGPVLVVQATKEDDPAIYPSALVDAWVQQENRGTEALRHERLITLAGGILYVVAVLRTIYADP